MAAVTKNFCSAAAWASTTAYSVGHRRTNDSSKLYECTTAGTSAGSGGPTGTGSGISDGSCVWNYLCTVDYSTWATAETATESASGSDTWTIQAWANASLASGLATETVLTSKVTWSGSTASSLTVTVAAGDSFIDHSSALTNPRKYDASKGYGVSQNSDSADCFFVSEASTFNRFQFRTASPGSTVSRPFAADASSGGVTLRNSLCQADGPHTACIDLFRTVNKAINCLAISNQTGTNARGIWVSSGNCYNCTAIRPSNVSGGSGIGIDSILYSTGIAKNCVSFGFPTPFSTTGSGFDAASDYNLSDGTSPGSHSLSSKTGTNNYTSLDNANANFLRIKTSPTDIVAGTRDATNTSDLDVFGQARSTTTPTIGWEEYVSSASIIGPLMGGHLTNQGPLVGGRLALA